MGDLIKATMSSDRVDLAFDTTGATSGQVPTWNGTNVVWNAPSLSSINDGATVDFTLDGSGQLTAEVIVSP